MDLVYATAKKTTGWMVSVNEARAGSKMPQFRLVQVTVNVFLPSPVTTSMPGEATVSLRSESIQARPRGWMPAVTSSQKTIHPLAASITCTSPSGQNRVTTIQTTAMRRNTREPRRQSNFPTPRDTVPASTLFCQGTGFDIVYGYCSYGSCNM